MKKIATATIATAGVATFGFAQHEADAAENNNGGYNPNDPTSYEYSYTIDQQGQYHYSWKGNWSPNSLNQGSQGYSYNNQQATQSHRNNYSQESYTANNNHSRSYNNHKVSNNNYSVSTTNAPSSSSKSTNSTRSSSSSVSLSSASGSSTNLYTAGQCTYYVYDKVGGKIGSTWGNANNWASAASAAGYTVNNTPSSGSILQTSAGGYGHVAYVENVNSDGSVTVSEMNYGQGPGVVTTRTISASQASSYNYIH
ncbi:MULTISPECIES: CHAP domain-containing protein [Staphylococcus]|uniref:CHAP domain-containing protein n=1 Tax=Staphylococcus hsinchuensis TaxID=3051183 RepID=A0ABZ3EE98_9STAP|nr:MULTISPECIES: CHAP domain-containing protein [unclassified Staphylococcus]